MANPVQFDLNAEIQAWRNRLSSSPELRAENLDELESHLRDSVAALRQKGLTEAEAFLIATQRIGSPTALQPEFAKVNAREVWLDRLLWMVLGVQLWAFIVGFSFSTLKADGNLGADDLWQRQRFQGAPITNLAFPVSLRLRCSVQFQHLALFVARATRRNRPFGADIEYRTPPAIVGVIGCPRRNRVPCHPDCWLRGRDAYNETPLLSAGSRGNSFEIVDLDDHQFRANGRHVDIGGGPCPTVLSQQDSTSLNSRSVGRISRQDRLWIKKEPIRNGWALFPKSVFSNP